MCVNCLDYYGFYHQPPQGRPFDFPKYGSPTFSDKEKWENDVRLGKVVEASIKLREATKSYNEYIAFKKATTSSS